MTKLDFSKINRSSSKSFNEQKSLIKKIDCALLCVSKTA